MRTRVLEPLLLASASGAAMLMFGPQARAQTPPAESAAEPPAEGLQDIVVTARRTEESLQTTPVAVTAVGAKMIQNAQIVDTTGLQRVAPSVSIAQGSPASSGIVYVSIRGSGNLNPGVANDAAVGTYIDGVYIPRPSQGQTDLNDLQRIEVLRGPQGTLFGRNTTGGALNIITADPTGELGGSVRAAIGNYDYRNVNAILNVPLAGDELGLRVSYNFREHDGYGYNASLKREAGDLKSNFVRGKLRWAPAGSAWDVTVTGDYNKITDHGQIIAASAIDAGNATLNAIGARLGINIAAVSAPFIHAKEHWYTIYGTGFANDPKKRLPADSLEAYGFSGTINGEIGGVKVKSISGYRYSYALGTTDLDGLPLAIYSSQTGYRSRQFSQEVQVLGDIGTRFNWIVGGYYSRETGLEFSDAQSLGLIGSPIFRNDADIENISTGVFGQGYYQLSDRIRLAAGLRWTWDKRNVVLHNVNLSGQPGNIDSSTAPGFQPNCNVPNPDGGILEPCNQTQKADFDYPAWTVGFDFEASREVFLYVKSSRAAKAGGFNVRVGSLPAFKPEKVQDVEAGLKMTTPDRRLRANVAIFHIWQSDVQRQANAIVNVGGTPVSTQFLLNAGKTRIRGAEVEISALPWPTLELTGNFSVLGGNYKRGSFFDSLAGGVRVDRSDEPLPQLPSHQFNVGATQRVPTALGDLSLHADYAYIASQSFGTLTAAPTATAAQKAAVTKLNQLTRIASYGLLNGRVAFQLAKPDIELAVFARNITGKKYVTRAFTGTYSTLGVAIEYVGEPFTWGVSASYKF